MARNLRSRLPGSGARITPGPVIVPFLLHVSRTINCVTDSKNSLPRPAEIGSLCNYGVSIVGTYAETTEQREMPECYCSTDLRTSPFLSKSAVRICVISSTRPPSASCQVQRVGISRLEGWVSAFIYITIP
ncbi:hypothetical protein N658DRAFT_118238 [Parathielavia hyrcaniae]|uniref:Uncharacterized protein n=1 Tax=Parathielavia hyrcaniae TaxID=113614 RepID=A0AAN6T654_9PEZI|nr:hypothetical protein N658DRAFT_118238 [Parathielavia hyrcaniae]